MSLLHIKAGRFAFTARLEDDLDAISLGEIAERRLDGQGGIGVAYLQMTGVRTLLELASCADFVGRPDTSST